jgi:hypothetical protein
MKIKALSNIGHNGQGYFAGDVLDVTRDQAEALIEAGAAVHLEKQPQPERVAEPEQTPEPEQTEEQVKQPEAKK